MEYIINTSFHCAADIFDEVIATVNNGLRNAAADSGLFSRTLMLKLLIQADEHTRGFSLQLCTDSLEKAVDWLEGEGNRYFHQLHATYGERVVFFTTPMEIING